MSLQEIIIELSILILALQRHGDAVEEAVDLLNDAQSVLEQERGS